MNYLEKPNKELLLDILTNIGTDEQTIRNDVKALIEWLEKTPYLPSNKGKSYSFKFSYFDLAHLIAALFWGRKNSINFLFFKYKNW